MGVMCPIWLLNKYVTVLLNYGQADQWTENWMYSICMGYEFMQSFKRRFGSMTMGERNIPQ